MQTARFVAALAPILLVSLCPGQAPDQVKFEVASVKANTSGAGDFSNDVTPEGRLALAISRGGTSSAGHTSCGIFRFQEVPDGSRARVSTSKLGLRLRYRAKRWTKCCGVCSPNASN